MPLLRKVLRSPLRRRMRWRAMANPKSPCSPAAASGACRASSSMSKGVDQRGLRLCRRRGRRRRTTRWSSTGTTGHAESVEITFDPAQDQLRPAPADLFLGRARSDRAQPPGAGHRHAISLGDLSDERRAGEDRQGLHRPARPGARLRRADRHHDRTRPGLLSGRGLSPGFPDAASRPIPISSINDLPKIANLKRIFPDLYREDPALVSEAGNIN